MIKIVNLDSLCCGKNSYQFLSGIKDKHGVYVFFEADSGTVFYVGEARDQDLKTRSTQNFAPNDRGGTFRKNYMELKSKSYEEFIEQVKKLKILFITSESNMAVKALESLLIMLLKPKFNKDT